MLPRLSAAEVLTGSCYGVKHISQGPCTVLKPTTCKSRAASIRNIDGIKDCSKVATTSQMDPFETQGEPVRLSHLEVERLRRLKAKQYFDELRCLVPGGMDPKCDRNRILQMVVDHVKTLKGNAGVNNAGDAIPKFDTDKRLSHNELEQRRRQQARHHYEDLRALLPGGGCKLDKNGILLHTIRALQQLSGVTDDILRQRVAEYAAVDPERSLFAERSPIHGAPVSPSPAAAQTRTKHSPSHQESPSSHPPNGPSTPSESPAGGGGGTRNGEEGHGGNAAAAAAAVGGSNRSAGLTGGSHEPVDNGGDSCSHPSCDSAQKRSSVGGVCGGASRGRGRGGGGDAAGGRGGMDALLAALSFDAAAVVWVRQGEGADGGAAERALASCGTGRWLGFAAALACEDSEGAACDVGEGGVAERKEAEETRVVAGGTQHECEGSEPDADGRGVVVALAAETASAVGGRERRSEELGGAVSAGEEGRGRRSASPSDVSEALCGFACGRKRTSGERDEVFADGEEGYRCGKVTVRELPLAGDSSAE